MDRSSGTPISDARISLLGPQLELLHTTRSDPGGRWSIPIEGSDSLGYLAGKAEGYNASLSRLPSSFEDTLLTRLRPIVPREGAKGRIIGRVYDLRTGEPVELVQVHIDEDETLLTNGRGMFEVRDVVAEISLLEFSHAAYLARLMVVRILPGEIAEILVTMSNLSFELEPIEVTVRRPARSRDLDEFFRRRESHFGHFFTRQDLDQLVVGRLADILKHVPNIRFAASPSARIGTHHVRFRGGVCVPRVWINGVQRSLAWSEVELASLLAVDLEAVEVYRGGEVPAEFFDPAEGLPCVTIVAWTR